LTYNWLAVNQTVARLVLQKATKNWSAGRGGTLPGLPILAAGGIVPPAFFLPAPAGPGGFMGYAPPGLGRAARLHRRYGGPGWGRLNAHRTLLASRSATNLKVSGAARAPTRVRLAEKSPVAASHDLLCGDVAQLGESAAGVALGAATGRLDDAVEPELLGREDAAVPPAGRSFFYLVRPKGAPGADEYGGSSRHRDRRAAADDCAR
jgi:hypothetical protein